MNLSKYLEHTLLQPQATSDDIRVHCKEAVDLGVPRICINPAWVALAAEETASANLQIVTVAGFPLGTSRTDVKLRECEMAVADGATEIDLVANTGAMLDDRYLDVETEIRTIRRHLPDSIALKVIVEGSLLSPDYLREAARTVLSAGAEFIKTGTGFFGGVTVEQIQLLHQTVGGLLPIKAAGGVRSAEQCRKLIEAGAVRIGSSACRSILKG